MSGVKGKPKAPAMGRMEMGGHEGGFNWVEGFMDVIAAHTLKRGVLACEGWELAHTIVIRNSRPNSWLFTSGGFLYFTYESADLAPGALIKEIFRAAATACGAERGGPDKLSIVAQVIPLPSQNRALRPGRGAFASVG